MADANIRAVITAEDRASKTLSMFSTKLGDLSVGAVALAGAIGVAAKSAFDFLGESIKQYSEAERSTRMLEHAVIDVTHATREQLDQTNKLAEAISKKGVLDDDVIKQGLAQLSTFGLTNKAVQGLAQSLADLTVNQSGVYATGQQAEQAANDMAKALRGQFGILERQGIIFTDAQKNLILYGNETEKVRAVQEGFAQNLKYTNEIAKNTTEGGLARLNVALGNMQESIGSALAPAVSILAEKLQGFVESDQFQHWLETVTTWIRDQLPVFLDKLFNEYIPKAKQAFDEWWPKIETVASWIGNLIGSIVWLGQQIEDWSSQVGLGIGVVVMAFDNVKKTIEQFGADAYNAINGFINGAKQIFADWKNGIARTLDEITGWFRSLPSSIANGLGGLFDAITKPFRDAFNWVKDNAGKIGESVKNVGGGFKLELPHFASGVQNFSGGLAVVGERGPELVNLPRGADVIPNGQIGSVGGSSTINVSVNVGVYAGSELEKRKVAQDLFRALQDVANQKNMTVSQMFGG